MPAFSSVSLKKLGTCDPLLQELMKNVVMKYDIIVVCGYRNESEQNLAFANGASKARWPHSQHNIYPSTAVDIAPYPYNQYKNDVAKHYEMAAYVLEVATKMKIPLIWGGNWKIREVSKLIDLPHFQLA